MGSRFIALSLWNSILSCPGGRLWLRKLYPQEVIPGEEGGLCPDTSQHTCSACTCTDRAQVNTPKKISSWYATLRQRRAACSPGGHGVYTRCKNVTIQHSPSSVFRCFATCRRVAGGNMGKFIPLGLLLSSCLAYRPTILYRWPLRESRFVHGPWSSYNYVGQIGIDG